ncbi:pilus assembly protein TadG-related protein [Myxococcota bacterium]|nr:pilus assembly protein TadG-related protein [Myxococcota bacterium]
MIRRRQRQGGAVLPLYLFAMFALVGAFYLLHGIGWKITQRQQLQRAADRAAFSAAAVTSRALNLLEYVNAALASVRAVTATYQGIQQQWGPILADATSRCYSIIPDPIACAVMEAMNAHGPSIFAQMGQVGPQMQAADQALGMLGENIVGQTPGWAAQVAQQVALANKAEGSFTDPMQGDRLPFQLGGEKEMRGRVRRQAMRDWGPQPGPGWIPVIPTDPTIWILKPEYRAQWENAIRQSAQNGAGQRWVATYKTAKERREKLAITVFASRKNEDRARLNKFDAAGGQNTGDVFQQRTEVAVARAEPYFTLNNGEPDGRPGWSGRLRPVILKDDDSAQSLARAAGRGGSDPGVSAWRPAFQAVGANGVKVPH